jgi:hypothetical protein
MYGLCRAVPALDLTKRAIMLWRMPVFVLRRQSSSAPTTRCPDRLGRRPTGDRDRRVAEGSIAGGGTTPVHLLVLPQGLSQWSAPVLVPPVVKEMLSLWRGLAAARDPRASEHGSAGAGGCPLDADLHPMVLESSCVASFVFSQFMLIIFN